MDKEALENQLHKYDLQCSRAMTDINRLQNERNFGAALERAWERYTTAALNYQKVKAQLLKEVS